MVSVTPAKLSIPVVLEVEVDPQFVDLLLNYNDIFSNDYIGYWGYGDRKIKNLGWIVFEDEDFAMLLDELYPSHNQDEREQIVDAFVKDFVATYRKSLDTALQAHQDMDKPFDFDGFYREWRGMTVKGFDDPYRQMAELAYILDEHMAHRVIREGIKKFGASFQEDYDGNSLDNALQMALLGEVRYA